MKTKKTPPAEPGGGEIPAEVLTDADAKAEGLETGEREGTEDAAEVPETPEDMQNIETEDALRRIEVPEEDDEEVVAEGTNEEGPYRVLRHKLTGMERVEQSPQPGGASAEEDSEEEDSEEASAEEVAVRELRKMFLASEGTPHRILHTGTALKLGGTSVRLLSPVLITFERVEAESAFPGLLLENRENFRLNIGQLEGKYSATTGALLPPECPECGTELPPNGMCRYEECPANPAQVAAAKSPEGAEAPEPVKE